MQNFDLENIDCHATLAMIEKRWGFPRRTLRALLGMTKSGQSGRSMIEMLGVLAIIGVLSVGGIAGYSKAMQRYRINKTIEQISLISGNIHAFFAPQKNIYGLLKTVIRKAKLVPDEMLELNNDGTIKQINNIFGGTVSISTARKVVFTGTSAPSVSSTGKDYYLYFTGLSQEDCIDLVSHDWLSVPNLYAISMGFDPGTGGLNVQYTLDLTKGCAGFKNGPFGGYAGMACSNGSAFSLPIELDDAIKYCYLPSGNKLAFFFYLY